MGKEGALAPWKCWKVFYCKLSKTSVDEVFMHHFEKMSSASRSFVPIAPPGSGPWALPEDFRPSDPLIAHPWKKSCRCPWEPAKAYGLPLVIGWRATPPMLTSSTAVAYVVAVQLILSANKNETSFWLLVISTGLLVCLWVLTCGCSWRRAQRSEERRLIAELLRQASTAHQSSSDVLSAITVLTPQWRNTASSMTTANECALKHRRPIAVFQFIHAKPEQSINE